jgi:hypothetical protein
MPVVWKGGILGAEEKRREVCLKRYERDLGRRRIGGGKLCGSKGGGSFEEWRGLGDCDWVGMTI